jgi:hypothetical protein
MASAARANHYKQKPWMPDYGLVEDTYEWWQSPEEVLVTYVSPSLPPPSLSPSLSPSLPPSRLPIRCFCDGTPFLLVFSF